MKNLMVNWCLFGIHKWRHAYHSLSVFPVKFCINCDKVKPLNKIPFKKKRGQNDKS